MNDEALLATIAAVIGDRLGADPARITRETRAEDVDGWDSVTHTLIVMEIERRLAIGMDMNAAFDVADVGGLVDLAAQARGVEGRK